MPAERIQLDPNAPDSAIIQRVATAMAAGAVVVFPTETVYGVGATAANEAAVNRLREVKRRDANQPFTVHVSSREWAERYIPPLEGAGLHLMRKAWPGPVTLIFDVPEPQKMGVAQQLGDAGHQAVFGADAGSVAIRYPQDMVALDLLVAADAPVIASSANVSGQSPPISAADIADELANQVDFVLDAGPTRYRKASTIVLLKGSGFELLRPGVFDERIIRRLATVHILFVCTGNTCRSPIAEGLCRKLLAERIGCNMSELEAQGYVIESAGTMAWPGHPASPESLEVLATRGVELNDGRSQALGVELLHSADFVLTMTANHAEQARALSQRDAHKVRLLSQRDIGDPIGGPLEQYEAVAQEIEGALTTWLNEVQI